MPIDSRHPDFIKAAPGWTKCADFYEGSEAVKVQGQLYLPRPSGMTAAEYRAYKTRASYFNGVGRTVTGLVGAMTRMDAEYTLPLLIEHLDRNATGTGKTLQEFIKQTLTRVMTTGRFGVLVDREDSDPVHFVPYNEHSIINWRDDDGRPTLIVLEEFVLEVDPEDPYQAEIVPQFRELWLNSAEEYNARIWKRVKTGNRTTFEPGPVIVPESSVGPLRDIPFVFYSPVGTEIGIVKPPLADLCDINQSHYMVSADLEHGRHLVSLPTPVVTGADPDDYKKGLSIGSGMAWIIESPAAKAIMLEFTGQGLGHLAEAISEKQHQMAIMGAKLLQPQRKQVESAELARMANAGDESILVGISKSVGLGIEKALQFAAQWEGADPNAVQVQMNTDFIDTKLAADEMSAMLELYERDVYTLEEFLAQLKLGERLQGDPVEIAREARANAARKLQDEIALERSRRTADVGGSREAATAE